MDAELKRAKCGVEEPIVLVGSRLKRWVAVLRASTQKEGGCASLEHKTMDNVTNGANNAFSFTILGGGVGTRHAQVDATGQEERAGARVFELFVVVALDCLDGNAELCLHISKK